MLEKIRKWYRVLPDKKRYLEFITAFLTIPVLLTVIYTNITRIQDDKSEKQTLPTPEKIIIVTNTEKSNKDDEVVKGVSSIPSIPSPSSIPSPTSPKECKKEVGPVKISYPTEEQVVNDDMVCIKIDYTVGDYCSVAWSYKLDNNNWSGYSSSPFCFSNLNQGKHELDIRIQSTVSSDETTLERTFYYKSKDTPTPSPSNQQ